MSEMGHDMTKCEPAIWSGAVAGGNRVAEYFNHLIQANSLDIEAKGLRRMFQCVDPMDGMAGLLTRTVCASLVERGSSFRFP